MEKGQTITIDGVQYWPEAVVRNTPSWEIEKGYMVNEEALLRCWLQALKQDHDFDKFYELVCGETKADNGNVFRKIVVDSQARTDKDGNSNLGMCHRVSLSKTALKSKCRRLNSLIKDELGSEMVLPGDRGAVLKAIKQRASEIEVYLSSSEDDQADEQETTKED